jgi:hypothetical protein
VAGCTRTRAVFLGVLAAVFLVGLGSSFAASTVGAETTPTVTDVGADAGTTETFSDTVTAEAPTETVTVSDPEVTSTVVETVTESTQTTIAVAITPGAAAAAGAAAASTQEESSSSGDSTQWGWIAFGVLAAAVLIFTIVWLVRKRHA